MAADPLQPQVAFRDGAGVVFPFPFGGIDRCVEIRSRAQMQIAVNFLVGGCGDANHHHNIAVQMDGGLIWTTELGAKCVILALQNDRLPPG